MANLAIKGHSKRGSEVIERLEMLGGINSHNLYGDESYAYYTIDSDKEIKGGIYVFGDEDLSSFTLEEFEEKFPYKVGDKILYKVYGIYSKIKSMLWNKEKEQVFYRLESNKLFVATVDELNQYKVETMEGKVESFEILESHCADEVKIEFDPFKFEIVERDNGYYVVKKKTQYPKTYEECCKVLGIDIQFCMKYLPHGTFSYRDTLIYNLQELIICRDAYWKIAGEQMGLGKLWKPDFTNDDEERYGIYTAANKVVKDFCGVGDVNTILTFPTKEMRDAFYENFKDLIERCKELL